MLSCAPPLAPCTCMLCFSMHAWPSPWAASCSVWPAMMPACWFWRLAWMQELLATMLQRAGPAAGICPSSSRCVSCRWCSEG
jgi:hypothetical protein